MNATASAPPSRTARRRSVASALVGAALLVGLTACANPFSSGSPSASTSTSSPATTGSVAGSAKTSALSTASTAATGSTASPAAGSATAQPLVATGTAAKLASDLSTGAAHHNLQVDGENVGLKVDYWTTVPVTKWSVLGPADLHVAAYLSPKAATVPQVLVDRFTVTWQLDALTPGLNGVPLAEFVDTPSGATAGFQLTKTVSYSTIADRSDAGQTLFDRWAQLAPGQSIDAAALAKAGAYGITVQVRYDLSVKDAGDTNWHRRTVVDQLTTPLTTG